MGTIYIQQIWIIKQKKSTIKSNSKSVTGNATITSLFSDDVDILDSETHELFKNNNQQLFENNLNTKTESHIDLNFKSKYDIKF